MVIYDAQIGNALHLINTLGFAYYICWVGVTPFVDSSHFTQQYFPHRELGIAAAAVFLSGLVVVAITVASLHILFGNSSLPVKDAPKAAEPEDVADRAKSE